MSSSLDLKNKNLNKITNMEFEKIVEKKIDLDISHKKKKGLKHITAIKDFSDIITKTSNKLVKEEENILLPKQELLLKSLLQFYGDSNNLNMITPVVKQETRISLRLLDWLTTNFSKKHKIRYELGKIDGDIIPSSKNFNLWIDYKNQLKAYSKKQFDPFCRRQRVFFNTKLNEIFLITDENITEYSESEDGFITTVGQLNFFKWAIENKVIDYAFEHCDEIESDMLKSADQRIIKRNSGDNKRKLSKNNHSANSHEVKIIVQFQ